MPPPHLHPHPPRRAPQAVARFTLLAAAWACTVYAGHASAAAADAATGAACPEVPFVADVPPGAAALRQQLDALVPLADACDLRADFHARRGALLLALGRAEAAATALEKALMLNPALAGAQLDYAQALGRLGQGNAARDLAGQVAQRADIAPGLQRWLQGALAAPSRTEPTDAPTPPKHPSWAWGGLAQVALGRESNLLSSTYTSSLTLLLPGGPVDVPLADSERPVAGTAVRSLLALQGETTLALGAGPGRLRLGLLVDGRAAQPANGGAQAGTSVGSQGQLRAQAAWIGPVAPGLGAVHARVGAVRFNPPSGASGASNPYRDHSLALLYEPVAQPWGWAQAALGRCTWVGGIGTVRQRLPATPLLQGQYSQLQMEWACASTEAASPPEMPAQQTQLLLAAGRDQPDAADRPGGVKQRVEVQLRHERNLAWPYAWWAGQGGAGGSTTRISAWARLADSRDSTEFSPLLTAGRVHTRRLDWGVGHWWRLGGGWGVGLEWEALAQKSTNPLLRVRSRSVYAVLRWAGDLP